MPIICGCIAIGTHAAVATPRNDPMKPGCATPMTVIGVLLIVTSRPTIDGIAGEAPLPVGVADHGDRMAARRAVVLGRRAAGPSAGCTPMT